MIYGEGIEEWLRDEGRAIPSYRAWGGSKCFFLFMVNRIIKMPPQLFSFLFVSPMKRNAQRVGGGVIDFVTRRFEFSMGVSARCYVTL